MTDQPDLSGDAAASEPGSEPDSDAAGEVAGADRIGGGWLLAAALALIAVPVLVGFMFLREGNDSSASSDAVGTAVGDTGMGGGGMAGDDGGSVAVGVPAGVGDFTEIQASEIAIEFDGSGSGAILRVNTSIEVACAVAYGPSASLGSIATDTDMAGGGHTDHQPLMRGLTPGTDYSYRISATGPDGRLYQSGLMEFTFTPESGGVAAVQPPAPNVAGIASVTDVSSEFSAAFGGRNAIDGDLATEWSSAGDGDDAYIVLDFGEDMLVSGVGFRTREMTDGTSITNSFTVTVDGTAYGPFDAGPGLAVALVDFRGQVMRFDVETSTGGNTGAVEVEVYGETDM